MDRHAPAHARDGRRPGHRSRRAELVSRHLGDDDRGHDAAVGRARGLPLRARPRRRAGRRVRRRVSDRLDPLRARRVRRVSRRPRGEPVIPGLGRARAVGGRRGARRGGPVSADAAQVRVSAALPLAAALPDARAHGCARRPVDGHRARRHLRRLLPRPDARVVRARCHEPVLDGSRRRRDPDREGDARRRGVRARARARARRPGDLGGRRARERSGTDAARRDADAVARAHGHETGGMGMEMQP